VLSELMLALILMMMQISVMKSLRHPNIILFMAAVTKPSPCIGTLVGLGWFDVFVIG